MPLMVPQMGVVEDIVVVEWLVANGAVVTAGEQVVTIETEKAELSIVAPATGVIEILVSASDREVPIASILGYITP